MADDKGITLSHVLWAVGGGMLLGTWYANYQAEEKKKSRAEREYPDEIEAVCREIAELLDGLEYDDEDDWVEDDYRDLIKEYLEKYTDYEIEVAPDTSEGQPDILIDDLLALEVKLNPDKAERDRCVGQCAGYSREYVTWIILVNTPASRAGKLQKLLRDKGLERILVWSFG